MNGRARVANLACLATRKNCFMALGGRGTYSLAHLILVGSQVGQVGQ